MGRGNCQVPLSQRASSSGSNNPLGESLKMQAEPQFFSFGSAKEFLGGLSGLLNGDLLNSIEEECRQNESGKWWPEYEYVVLHASVEDVNLPSSIYKVTSMPLLCRYRYPYLSSIYKVTSLPSFPYLTCTWRCFFSHPSHTCICTY